MAAMTRIFSRLSENWYSPGNTTAMTYVEYIEYIGFISILKISGLQGPKLKI